MKKVSQLHLILFLQYPINILKFKEMNIDLGNATFIRDLGLHLKMWPYPVNERVLL